MISFNEDLLKKAEAMPEEVNEEALHEAMLNAISYLGASIGERDNMSMSTLEYVNKIYIEDKNEDICS